MIKLSRFATTMLALAGVIGALHVVLISFSAHGLAPRAPNPERAITLAGSANTWQITHLLAFMLVTAISEIVTAGWGKTVLRCAAVLLMLAALLFPSALFSVALGGPGFWAPYGGAASLAGWIAFAVGVLLASRSPARP